MSGVEFIVGTVLGSIPIALEIYDRSGRVFEIFSAFKQYPREVTVFKTKLDVQRTIFRNNAINLLTSITNDRPRVQEVINQPSSDVARHGLVMSLAYQNRLDALQESFEACGQIANHIHDCLQLICSQYDEFRAEVGERQHMSSSDWLKLVRTRFKLGLQKPRISKAIEELRNLNRDFVLITEQITKGLEEVMGEQTNVVGSTGRKQVKSLNVLQRYHRVRHASKALYSTVQVRWGCEAHRCHSFDVRILDFDPDSGKGKGKTKASIPQCVTCELAVTHDGSSYASRGPLRLEVEQACELSDESLGLQHEPEDVATMSQLATVLEENAGRFLVPTPAVNVGRQSSASTSKTRRFLNVFRKDSLNKKQKLSHEPLSFDQVSFQLPPPSNPFFELKPHENLELGDRVWTQATATASSDLSFGQDLCKTLNFATTSRTLLRSFNGPTRARWFSVPQGHDIPQIQCLSDMIRWIAEEPILRSLPRPLLVDVASNVAEGIMQFYSTPWLSPSNLGQQVRYLRCRSHSESDTQLNGPYFSARIESSGHDAQAKKPRGPIDSTGELARTTTASFDGARNQLLFNFGILLLEVGYGKPWEELKRTVAKATVVSGGNASDGGKVAAGRLSDYRAAEKLAQLLINQMGLAYPKVIKKCLGCDFGLGETDLENEDLQRRFVEDVVSALKQLREDMKKMDLEERGEEVFLQ